MSSTSWTGPFLRSQLCKGHGLAVEGLVKDVRVHSVFVRDSGVKVADQEDNLPTRYMVAVVEVQDVYPRLYQKNGEEVDYTDNNKRSRNYVEPVPLNLSQLLTKVGGGSGTALPDHLCDDRREQLHPKVQGVFEFWIDSNKPRSKDLQKGMQLRLLTQGESVFVDAFQFLNAKTNLFKDMGSQGEALSGQYADRIMQYAEPEAEVEDTRQGVDESEWDD